MEVLYANLGRTRARLAKIAVHNVKEEKKARAPNGRIKAVKKPPQIFTFCHPHPLPALHFNVVFNVHFVSFTEVFI